jgi:hypothetical protein
MIAASALICGLFLFFVGYVGAGFYLFLFGGLALWSMRHPRSSIPELSYRPRVVEPKVIPSIIPTLCAHPDPGTHCTDCDSDLMAAADAFYSVSDGERVFICAKCRDKRIIRKRALGSVASVIDGDTPR